MNNKSCESNCSLRVKIAASLFGTLFLVACSGSDIGNASEVKAAQQKVIESVVLHTEGTMQDFWDTLIKLSKSSYVKPLSQVFTKSTALKIEDFNDELTHRKVAICISKFDLIVILRMESELRLIITDKNCPNAVFGEIKDGTFKISPLEIHGVDMRLYESIIDIP